MIINNLEKVLEESELDGNQSELSRMCNITRGTISNIINQRQYPSFELALKIAYFLHVPVEKVFHYEPDKSDK